MPVLPDARTRTPAWTWWVLVVAMAAFAWHARIYWAWTEDDAFISLRYAWNLAHGAGLVFNPGERVEGFSNFSWVLLGAAAIRAGLDALAVLKVTGLVAAEAALLLSWRLARRLAPGQEAAALLAPCLLAISPVLAHHATAGLESGLFALLLLSQVMLATGPGGAWRRVALLKVSLLLALTRPEGAPIAAVVLGARAFTGWGADGGSRPAGRGAARADLAIFALAVAACLAARFSYYGSLLPNTYYAKGTGGLRAASNGFEYALAYLRDSGGVLLAGAALVPFLLGRAGRAHWIAMAAVLAYSGFVVLAGGDWMFHYRFFSHLQPLLCALVAAGLGTLVAAGAPGGAWGAPAVRAAVVLLLALTQVGVVSTERVTARLVLPAVRAGHYPSQGYEDLGRWLHEQVPPDAGIAISDVGAVGYFSQRPIVDMYGLIDPHIARLPGRVHYKVDPVYVLSRRPRYVVLVSHGDQGTGRVFGHLPDAAMNDQAEFHARYRLVRVQPTHWDDDFNLVYERVD